ncbi:nuclear transport factor 2 family protein [Massilia glaciei]|uniref:Nuclear transport factor 2 family protein n=1 Tax=Massilia glaciei TaxID=1524097 RepID=A0A2U2I5L8_9BURK|nr:nuclear transport factor 2 family protein [Massilia glaciei]PWF55050.1 nuclear transport factor 2 family protein [Massilia glaciei]
MNAEQTREAAGRFIARLKQLEQGQDNAVDGVAELFSGDAQLSNPILERGGRGCSGRDHIAAFWRAYGATFGTIHSEFFEVTVNDHSAGLFWHSSGTGPHGQPIDYDGVTLLEFDQSGHIARFKSYFDRDRVQLKAAPH